MHELVLFWGLFDTCMNFQVTQVFLQTNLFSVPTVDKKERRIYELRIKVYTLISIRDMHGDSTPQVYQRLANSCLTVKSCDGFVAS